MGTLPRVDLVPGYSIAPIINGCWQLTPDHGGGPGSRAATFAIFDELLASGFTTFDCADIYVGVEETIGAFRRTLADPDAIEVHTKLVPDKATLHELRPEQVDAAIDRSRRRLGMDRLDLVQCHWWRYEVPGLAMMMDRLREAQARGKIRHIGTTNFDSAHIRELLDDGAPIVSLQAQYSLLDRRPERAMTTLSEERGVQLLPYGALAGGYLGERFLGASDAPPTNRSLTKYRLIIEEAGGWEVYQRLLDTLAEIGHRHEVSAAAVAARWVLDQPSVPALILGVGGSARVSERLAIARLSLEAEDHERLAEPLGALTVPPGDMYALERDPAGRHAGIIKTDLNAGPGSGHGSDGRSSAP